MVAKNSKRNLRGNDSDRAKLNQSAEKNTIDSIVEKLGWGEVGMGIFAQKTNTLKTLLSRLDFHKLKKLDSLQVGSEKIQLLKGKLLAILEKNSAEQLTSLDQLIIESFPKRKSTSGNVEPTVDTSSNTTNFVAS